MAAAKKARKTRKTTKKTRAKAPSKRAPRKHTYKLDRVELLELKVANMEFKELDAHVRRIAHAKIQPAFEAAMAEAAQAVPGWEEKKAALEELQERLQAKYGKRGYTMQNPDAETGEGILVKAK